MTRMTDWMSKARMSLPRSRELVIRKVVFDDYESRRDGGNGGMTPCYWGASRRDGGQSGNKRPLGM